MLRSITGRHPLAGEIFWQGHGLQWHGETFTPGAPRLDGTKRMVRNQAFLGPHLAMQCHVEMTPAMIAVGAKKLGKKGEFCHAPGPIRYRRHSKCAMRRATVYGTMRELNWRGESGLYQLAERAKTRLKDSVAEIAVLDRKISNAFWSSKAIACCEIITLGTGHAHGIPLDCRLNLHLESLSILTVFLCQLGFDADLDFQLL